MTRSQTNEEVKKYFLLLLVVLGGTAALLVLSVVLNFTEEAAKQNRVGQFHVRTLLLMQEAEARVPQLLEHFEEDGRPAHADGTSQRQVAVDMYVLERGIQSIRLLQAEFGENATQGSVDRAHQQLEAIATILEAPDPDLEHLERQVSALKLSLYQLQRLHSIAVSETLDRIGDSTRSRNLWFLAITVSIMLGALALIWRIFRMLRNTLKRHAELEAELMDRERLLQQSQRMQALGTLIGGVAHDFNNLLTAIIGNAEVVLSELPPDDSAAQGLREIHKAGYTAAELTRQLLAFSRPEIARPRAVNLADTLRGTEPLLQRLIRADIEISFEHGQELPPVLIDPVQLEQVIINLAVNARDAMPTGGSLALKVMAVEIGGDGTVNPDLPPGSYVKFSVEDTGTGMSLDTKERLFEPFFTTKDRGKGTGLGLSTVHGIVTKAAGFIFVESQPGGGARFDIFLPTCEPAPQVADPKATPSPKGGSETILLAEDTPSVRTFIARGLTSAGYNVHVAEDGNDALKVCQRHDGVIHALVTDVIMPLMGGPELAREIRSLYPEIRVIFISGYSEELAKGKLQSPAQEVIAKPFSIDELLTVLRHQLDTPLTEVTTET